MAALADDPRLAVRTAQEVRDKKCQGCGDICATIKSIAPEILT